jgi:hypothetical protein
MVCCAENPAPDDFNAYLEEILEAKRAAAAEDAVFPCVLEIL